MKRVIIGEKCIGCGIINKFYDVVYICFLIF